MSVVVVCRRRLVVDVVVTSSCLLFGAVSTDHALTHWYCLVEPGVVHLVHAVLTPVLHQSLKPVPPQYLARQIRRPRLVT